MAPYTAGQYTGGYLTSTAFNRELVKIEQAFLQYLERTGTVGNSMEQPLDMNGHEIVNVTTGDSPSSLMTREATEALLGTGVNVIALVQDIQDLQGNLLNLTATQDFLLGEVNTVKSDVTDLDTNLSTTQGELTTTQDNLSATQSLLAATRTTLNQLQGNVTALTQSLSTVQSLAVQNETAITDLQTELANSTTALTTAETDISDLQAGILNIQTITNSLAADVASVQFQIGQLNPSLAQANRDDILVLVGNVDTINTTIGQLQSAQSTLSAIVTDNQANVATLANRPLGFSFQGSLPDNTEVAKYVMAKPAVLRATGGSTATGANRGHTSVPATSGNADLEILQNGTVVGTILFGVDANTATFNIPADVTFGRGTQLILRTGTQLELQSPAITLILQEVL